MKLKRQITSKFFLKIEHFDKEKCEFPKIDSEE